MSETEFTYLVIQPSGTSYEHRQLADEEKIGDLLRAAIGGWLESVTVADPGLAVWCDEEGRLKGLAPNRIGSRLIALLGGPGYVHVGPIVVTGAAGYHTVALTDEQLQTVRSLIDISGQA